MTLLNTRLIDKTRGICPALSIYMLFQSINCIYVLHTTLAPPRLGADPYIIVAQVQRGRPADRYIRKAAFFVELRERRRGCRKVPIIVRLTAWINGAYCHVDTEDPHAVITERGVHDGHVSHQILHCNLSRPRRGPQEKQDANRSSPVLSLAILIYVRGERYHRSAVNPKHLSFARSRMILATPGVGFTTGKNNSQTVAIRIAARESLSSEQDPTYPKCFS
jgi:hypothetical protein